MSTAPGYAHQVVEGLAGLLRQALDRAQQAERLLTVDELAALWSVSSSTVRSLIRSGRLPEVRISDDLVRVRASDADEYVRRVASSRRS